MKKYVWVLVLCACGSSNDEPAVTMAGAGGDIASVLHTGGETAGSGAAGSRVIQLGDSGAAGTAGTSGGSGGTTGGSGGTFEPTGGTEAVSGGTGGVEPTDAGPDATIEPVHDAAVEPDAGAPADARAPECEGSKGDGCEAAVFCSGAGYCCAEGYCGCVVGGLCIPW